MEKHDPKRRAVLIGTLATGATFVLYGCKGKQEEAATGGEAAPVGEAAPAPTGGAPAAAKDGAAQPMETEPSPKMSKEKAQYQAKPSGDRKCANCSNFIAESKTCKVVEGEVSPEGWCILWATA